jgi:signal transduction histidine kinase
MLAVLDGIDAHVYVADMQTYRVLFMNSKMRRDFGRDMQGEICWQVFRHGDGPCEHCSNHLLLDDAGEPTGVNEWESYNPVVGCWYNNYDRAIQWIDGRWVRLQIAVDISRLKVMEEEQKRNAEKLRRAERFETIGTLAGGIAHDFNNLLQVILGHLSILEMDCARDGDIMAALGEIKRAAHKSRKLANRLITFTAGGAPNVVLVPITRMLEATVSKATTGKAVASQVDIAADLRPTPIDIEQMTLVLEAVVSNAMESMAGDGRLTVDAGNLSLPSADGPPDADLPDGDYVKVTIGDNGRGISDDVLPRIFDPYFSTKQRGADKGMGLSLSVAYSIVRQHRGHIHIASRVGRGTRVEIYLPAQTVV